MFGWFDLALSTVGTLDQTKQTFVSRCLLRFKTFGAVLAPTCHTEPTIVFLTKDIFETTFASMRIFQTFHTVSTLVFTRLQFIQFAAITLRQLHSTQLLVFFILLKFPLAAAAELLSQNSGHVETIKALYKFKGRLFWFLNNFGLQK